MDFDFQGLTLANACGGRVEDRFQEALADVVEAFSDPLLFQATTDGKVSMNVSIEMVFTIDANVAAQAGVDSALKTMTAGVVVKRPKRKGVAAAVHIQSGAMLTQPNLEQLDMLAGRKKEPKVVPHPAARGGETE